MLSYIYSSLIYLLLNIFEGMKLRGLPGKFGVLPIKRFGIERVVASFK
jgi:hypothetical protein